jgi:hypothetical protein
MQTESPSNATLITNAVPGPVTQIPTHSDTAMQRQPAQSFRSNGAAASQPWPVPLTVLGELLGRHPTTPYKAAMRFGLSNWCRAQVRDCLTRGATFVVELDLERTIRWNEEYLGRRARLVLTRKRHHRGRALDGPALAKMLGMRLAGTEADFEAVWLTFLREMADALVAAAREGYAEDVRTRAAEEYLDKSVAPRPRSLGKFNATPDLWVRPEFVDRPVSLLGGYKRMRRILDALSSDDPNVVQKMLSSWDVLRLQNPKLDVDVEWEDAAEPFSGILCVI